MREHPAVKVWRHGAVVENIAAGVVIARWFDRRGADDLMVGKDIFGALCPGDGLTCHFGAGAIGANHGARAHLCRKAFATFVAFTGLKMHHADTVRVSRKTLKGANAPLGTLGLSPHAQPFVKVCPVNHAHKTIVDRDIHLLEGGRNHACRAGFGDQQAVWDRKVFDQPRRYRPAAWLDATGTVEQQHRVAVLRELLRRSRPCGTAAYDDHIK